MYENHRSRSRTRSHSRRPSNPSHEFPAHHPTEMSTRTGQQKHLVADSTGYYYAPGPPPYDPRPTAYTSHHYVDPYLNRGRRPSTHAPRPVDNSLLHREWKPHSGRNDHGESRYISHKHTASAVPQVYVQPQPSYDLRPARSRRHSFGNVGHQAHTPHYSANIAPTVAVPRRPSRHADDWEYERESPYVAVDPFKSRSSRHKGHRSSTHVAPNTAAFPRSSGQADNFENEWRGPSVAVDPYKSSSSRHKSHKSMFSGSQENYKFPREDTEHRESRPRRVSFNEIPERSTSKLARIMGVPESTWTGQAQLVESRSTPRPQHRSLFDKLVKRFRSKKPRNF